MRRTALVVITCAVLVAWGSSQLLLHLRAAAVLLSVVGAGGAELPAVVRWVTSETRAVEQDLPLGSRRVRSRVYSPVGVRPRAPVMLVHGVHPDGIDEPRQQAFAHALAAVGLEVHTPELSELASYRVLPSTIDDLADCAQAVGRSFLREHKLLDGRAPGAWGISFSGGLLLLAAAREPTRLDYVVTVGSHHDLRRLARYYAGVPVSSPSGDTRAPHPHPYGARVMIAAYAEMFFSPADLQGARAALEQWLLGQRKKARELAERLSDTGRERLLLVLGDTHPDELNRLLLDAVAHNDRALRAVSPVGQLGSLRVPAFLVHGQGDPIIPSLETRWLAQEVPKAALGAMLVTPALRHAEAGDPASLQENLELLRFTAKVLAAAED
jgi:pimeloyl-ACP methyl ester carboxylesterase